MIQASLYLFFVFYGSNCNCRKFQYFRSLLPQFFSHGGDQFFRPGHQYFAAGKRQFFIPGEFFSSTADSAHHDNRRCFNSLPVYFLFQRCHGSHDFFLSCRCSLLENGCRCVRIHPCSKQMAADILQCRHSHQKYQGTTGADQCFKINVIFLSGLFVTGNDVY